MNLNDSALDSLEILLKNTVDDSNGFLTGFELDRRLKKLKVNFKPLFIKTLKSTYKFENFTATLDYKETSELRQNLFDSFNPLTVSHRHPHISSGRVCLGNGYYIFRNAFIEGDLFYCICILKSVLSTYNGDSPHYSISNFSSLRVNSSLNFTSKGKCKDCGKTYTKAFNCNRGACPSCGIKCNICNKYHYYKEFYFYRDKNSKRLFRCCSYCAPLRLHYKRTYQKKDYYLQVTHTSDSEIFRIKFRRQDDISSEINIEKEFLFNRSEEIATRVRFAFKYSEELHPLFNETNF